MNRNSELHFSNVPKIHLKRSKFDMSNSYKTTFNTGDIIPIYTDADITPGDTVTMDMAEVVRMATPLYPVMDNLTLDLMWFFVPHRLVWDHWREFWGENDDPWTQTTEYEVPKIKTPSGGWAKGTIADYMGVPTYVEDLGGLDENGVAKGINALPFRAYAKIFNDWFRDENLKSNCNIYKDETTRTGSNGTSYVTDVEKGGMPAKAAKTHDYFTSALPAPQKGPDVALPLGIKAPVYAGSTYTGSLNEGRNPVAYKYSSFDGTDPWHTFPVADTMTFNQVIWNGKSRINSSQTDTDIQYYTTPVNLYADLKYATAATINQLRTAFAIQKFYEQAGRNGTRYTEFLRSVFGVESSDARIQRSEYLGGTRIPINIDQVLQTSSTDAVSPQGNTGAFSCTINRDNMFTKSFEEHGTLICMAVVRVTHRTYQQGLKRMWTRSKWTDFYNPYFAHLGEQPIRNDQIYAQGTTKDEEVFGYQEAWAEYRYKENIVTGAMRSNNPGGGLDAWHYADDYSQLPTLTGTWIDEPTSNVDRTIAVQSEIENQFIADFYFKTAYTRVMPVYSIPGLIDHV